MIQELPMLDRQLHPFRFKRYYESKNNKIRIFGQCEVTGKNFEMYVPADGFFIYLQGYRNIGDAFKNTSVEEREFILTGTSPDGGKILLANPSKN